MVRLIGLDLDGTTLGNDRQISKRTEKALREASEKGIEIVIATGRSFYSLPKCICELDFIKYIISSNGGEVRLLSNQKLLKQSLIPRTAVEKIYNELQNENVMIELFIDGKPYIERGDYEKILDGKIPYRNMNYVEKTRTPVEDILKKMLDEKENLENINMFFHNLEEKQRLKNILGKIEEINITSSIYENLEIGGINSSKSEGLNFICDKLGISKSEVMAFGDGLNDIDMIRFAGIGVSMDNANDDVKDIADLIAPKNNLDGVAKVIEKLVLDRKL